jgi:diguanylate cyclase (GGDEF)-like protein/PAS domain S-box-containing protein
MPVKVRYKIAVSVIPILLISIVAINASFGLFFKNYMKKQENSQITTVTEGLSSYFRSEKETYLSTANDWAHWDDTYNFMAGKNPEYIEKNLFEDTFDNLNLSFLILLDANRKQIYGQFYGPDTGFTDFPDGFSAAMTTAEGSISGNGAFCGIFRLGGGYYFLAASGITDSLSEKAPVGKLVLGRRIDDGMLGKIADITGCSVGLLSAAGELTPEASDGRDAVLYRTGLTADKRAQELTFVIPNPVDSQSSPMLTLSMPRDNFVSAMREVRVFSVINTAVLVVLAAVIVNLVGRYLARPISTLVSRIKQIDITKTPIGKLDESGQDEFAFIRKSINQLLGNIETYHQQLAKSREELRATLVSVGDGVITTDGKGLITFLNPVAEKLTGWSLGDALEQPVEQVFKIVNEYSREEIVSPVRTVFEKDAIVELANHTLLLSKDGTERPVEDTAAPIKDASGLTMGCVLVFRDFSDRKEKQRRIEYLSYHDQLTGLYNRRYFEQALKQLHVSKTLPLSFIYADLNGLKIINDAFGHGSGDLIIQWVAELFLSECRADDIVARIGGDEFVILLPRTSKAEVEALVERLKDGAATKKYRDIDLSISFGWDTKEYLHQSALEVLRNAEDIMYQKKILSNASKRNGIIKSILHTLHVKCPREEAHSARVRDLCESIGAAYGLNSDDIKELITSGELHDIGKIAIDEIVLNKTEPLSDADWAQIRRHPETGYRLLGATNEFSAIAEYVLSHHERWDGNGYPRNLKGTEINWKARVIAVADAYDAMTSDRPYRLALSPETAANEIRSGAGKQFDPDIARVFIEKVLQLTW